MKLILASASPRRKDLLEAAQIPFEIQAGDLEEVIEPGLTPGQVVESLAFQKAQDIAQKQTSPCLVLGADTLVCLDNEILGKPHTAEVAYEMLSKLKGQTHEVMTGVALIKVPEMKAEVAHCVSQVQMRDMSENEIHEYIATGEPLDKAGAYAIQGHAKAFIEGVVGPYDNIVGLPIDTVKDLLSRF